MRYVNNHQILLCSIQVMFTTLSSVSEKHIRTVAVDNSSDSEVEATESEGGNNNAIDYSADSESKQSDDDITLSTFTGSRTDKLRPKKSQKTYRFSKSNANVQQNINFIEIHLSMNDTVQTCQAAIPYFKMFLATK